MRGPTPISTYAEGVTGILWLFLSPKFGWKIAGTCVALAASLMLYVLSLFKAENAVAFVVAISTGIVVQLIALSFLASDWKRPALR